MRRQLCRLAVFAGKRPRPEFVHEALQAPAGNIIEPAGARRYAFAVFVKSPDPVNPAGWQRIDGFSQMLTDTGLATLGLRLGKLIDVL
ncbi:MULTISPECIES: hypothetical protein [unclassified Labrenzia]|uniref:hypothetical protein n=1 Tax=unclassified Labrenzia TaxID=2648686 RepID=UPI0012683504|nr:MULTISPECIES: hypothetical protein [unclassified Labrenzia]